MPEHKFLKRDINSICPNSQVVRDLLQEQKVEGSIASVCDSGVYSDMAGW